MATVLIYEHIIKNNDMYKVKIINCIHDEILLETPPELAEKYKNLLQQCMIEAANHYLKTVVMKAEAKIADNWYSLK